MKFTLFSAAMGILLVILFCSGCMNTSPQVPSQTTIPSTALTTVPVMVVPTPEVTAYPGALSLGQYATFGTEGRQAQATIYKYEIRENYNWTSPTFSGMGGQLAASRPDEIQRGYTTEKPRVGDTFLFIYVRMINTGTAAIYAPSPSQFVVSTNGTVYNYTPVFSSDAVIDTVSGTQYDYQIGRGGVVGYLQPGESNMADGYLIYEVPASIPLNDTYVLVNLDYQTRAVWRLG